MYVIVLDKRLHSVRLRATSSKLPSPKGSDSAKSESETYYQIRIRASIRLYSKSEFKIDLF